MTDSVDRSAVKLPTFDGEAKNFELWWRRFLAFAGSHRFKPALRKGGEADMPASEATANDETTTAGKAAEAAKKRNETAMTCLTQAFTAASLMGLVDKSCSKDWPEGLAHLVVERLFKKYQPEDTITRVELRQMLNKIKMKKNEDPAKLFEQISQVENRYVRAGYALDPADLIAVVMDAAPHEYQAVLTGEQRRLGAKLTMDDMEATMNQHWRQIKHERKSDDGDNEFTLSAFQGTCFHCKEKGHRANKCPKKGKDESKSKNASGGGNNSTNNNNNSGNNSEEKKKFTGKCFNCGKDGHRSSDCWYKEENKDKRPNGFRMSTERGAAAVDSNSNNNNDTRVEFLLMGGMTFPMTAELLDDPNVWIGDTGATMHMTPFADGLSNLRNANTNESVTMANKSTESATQIGNLNGTICDKYGNEVGTTTIRDVALVPKCGYNLFSITKLLKDNWSLAGSKDCLTLTKDGKEIVFDICIPTPKGMIFAMYVRRDSEMAGAATDEKKIKMTMQQAHERLGHCGGDVTRLAVKQLGWEVTGTQKPCDACAAGKAKQKNVPKEKAEDTKDSVNRIFLDIATVKKAAGQPRPTKPVWRIMVDGLTQLKFSDFFAKKNEMVEPTCEQFMKWAQAGKAVQAVRLDNAGENKLLKRRAQSSDWKLGIEFEFTARDTPQQNSLAEVGFATIANRGRAILHHANIPYSIRPRVWTEAFKTATLLDGLLPIEIDGKAATKYEHWCGKNPEFANHLRTWGEAGTVKTKTDTTPKLADRGVQCMFVGYALDHAGDCYRMWNPVTKRVHESRDVIWMHRMFYPKPVKAEDIAIGPVDLDVTIPDDDDEDDNDDDNDDDDEDENKEAGEGKGDDDDDDEDVGGLWVRTTRAGRQVRAPRRLIEEIGAVAAAYEIRLTSAETKYYEAMKEFPEGEFAPGELACVGAGIGGGFSDTNELHVMKYDEAMSSGDAEKWEKSVDQEHDRMDHHKVFQVVPMNELPVGAKVLTSTWAMKKKSNGDYRARLNARGYEQVDGVHYDEDAKSAPVASEAAIHIVLILLIMAMWAAQLIDVNGAFLYGTFEKGRKVYMKVPQGFEKFYPLECYLLLLKTLYGTKQAARAFWIKLLAAFKAMGYTRSKADPCLYYKWTEHGLVVWISWVDDCLVCGSEEGVRIAKAQMMKQFECEDVGELKEYIGCKVERNKEEQWIKLTQPVLMQSYKDEFEIPTNEKVPTTPAIPGEVLQKGEPANYLNEDDQKTYRSGVGKLLHMMKWTRPDILNAVRELSRFMSGATLAHLSAMKRAMRYCIGTPNRGLLLKPDKAWNGDPNFEFVVSGRSDSDYAKDPDRRRSVSGYSAFLCGAPVTMRCRMQGCVTLSVTEAEMVSATQCAQDMLFVMRVVESMGLKVVKPMILEVDNKGAIDLSHNWSVSGRSRHDSVRQSFLRELEEEQVLTLKWIPTDDNSADLFTKNLPGPAFAKHTAVYCGVDEYTKDSQREGVRG